MTELETTELLREISQERREKVVDAVEGEETPDFLIKVSQTEILYTFDPVALPFKLVNFDDFSKQLKDLYSLSTDLGNQVEETDDPISVITGQKPKANRIRFINGKFELSNRDFIEIQSLNFTRELVHVVLKGPSTIADVIIADAVEALWKCSGASKKWEDISKSVLLKDYGTTTKVRLGVKLEEFLAPKLWSFIDNECINGSRYAVQSTPKSYLNNFNAPDEVFANCFVDDINLLFSVVDKETGASSKIKLKFSIVANSEYGSGVYGVTSELPYELHIEMLKKLQQQLTS